MHARARARVRVYVIAEREIERNVEKVTMMRERAVFLSNRRDARNTTRWNRENVTAREARTVAANRRSTARERERYRRNNRGISNNYRRELITRAREKKNKEGRDHLPRNYCRRRGSAECRENNKTPLFHLEAFYAARVPFPRRRLSTLGESSLRILYGV